MYPGVIFYCTGSSSRTKRAAHTTGVVAFHAVLGWTETANLGIHQNMHFSMEPLNIGDSYQNAHVRFIALIPGMYVFAVS